jgi:phosphomannomutase
MDKILLLFDVDGTLTAPRLHISTEMLDLLKKLNKIENIDLGFVGGSDLSKQIEQLGEENLHLFTWKFTENGLVSYEKDKLLHKISIIEKLGEQNYQHLINVCLKVLSETVLPIKRGNFIELRQGMINISPIGRSCTQLERENFYKWDQTNNIRENIIEQIQNDVKHLDLQFSIGGQISIDIFPKGWDKTYCLPFIQNKYKQIYFFGDKTEKGGNDYEIYNDARVKGFNVKKYTDTMELLNHFLE